LTPYNPGYLSGSFVFTYEDADGNDYSQGCPFSFIVMGGEEMFDNPMWDGGDEGIRFGPDGQPIDEGQDGEKQSKGIWLFSDMNPIKWAIIIGGGALVIVIITVVIAAVVKAKRRKAENDGDDEL
jgi:hypothetical protein